MQGPCEARSGTDHRRLLPHSPLGMLTWPSSGVAQQHLLQRRLSDVAGAMAPRIDGNRQQPHSPPTERPGLQHGSSPARPRDAPCAMRPARMRAPRRRLPSRGRRRRSWWRGGCSAGSSPDAVGPDRRAYVEQGPGCLPHSNHVRDDGRTSTHRHTPEERPDQASRVVERVFIDGNRRRPH